TEHIDGIVYGKAKRTGLRDRFGHGLSLRLARRGFSIGVGLSLHGRDLRRVLGALKPRFLQVARERRRAFILEARDRDVDGDEQIYDGLTPGRPHPANRVSRDGELLRCGVQLDHVPASDTRAMGINRHVDTIRTFWCPMSSAWC